MAYILYYTPRDKASARFYNDLCALQSIKEATQCVDVDTHRSALPPYVTAVPTFVINSGGQRVLVGSAAFAWLEKAREQEVGVFDGLGSMGGTSLGYSELDGTGYIASQPRFLDLSSFGA
jgi:hypothetical protein